MTYEAISFDQKFSMFRDQFSPKVIAQVNDYQFKLVRAEGDFVWHTHEETDEAFVVIDGELVIEFRDGSVTLRAGEMFVVPKGKEHKPFARTECRLLIVEPSGITNTGDAEPGTLTAPRDVWI